MRTIVGITGASGVIYGLRLLEILREEKIAVISENAWRVIKEETDYERSEIERLAKTYDNGDFSSPLASGSFFFDAYVICPCTVSTMSKIACGISDNLITRLGAIALKERRKFVIVIRETPLSTVSLENMARLSLQGVTILPAMPAFYPRPKKVSEMVDFVVGRILDCLGMENSMFKRWKGG